MCKQCGDIFKGHPTSNAVTHDLTGRDFQAVIRVHERKNTIRGMRSSEIMFYSKGRTSKKALVYSLLSIQIITQNRKDVS